MKNFTIRLAQNTDSESVYKLITDAGFALQGVDFSDLYPYWLVAENGVGVVGCLQVLVGKPIGRMELMAADYHLSQRDRAKVLKLLVETGEETLRQGGSQLVSGVVSFKNPGFKRLLKKRGAVVATSGNLMVARL